MLFRSLKGVCCFSRAWICQVICTLSPYKAPGPDLIPNVVLIKCSNVLIDHLFHIFKAVFEHKVYHPRWLESTTLVLRKIGKPAYDMAKAYRPIGLIDTIPKVFSTLCAKHLSYLAEKHSMTSRHRNSGAGRAETLRTPCCLCPTRSKKRGERASQQRRFS